MPDEVEHYEVILFEQEGNDSSAATISRLEQIAKAIREKTAV